MWPCVVQVQQLRDQLSQQEEAMKVSMVNHVTGAHIRLQVEEMGLQKLRQQLKDIQEEEQQLEAQVG